MMLLLGGFQVIAPCCGLLITMLEYYENSNAAGVLNRRCVIRYVTLIKIEIIQYALF